jgi:hypothetical protein
MISAISTRDQKKQDKRNARILKHKEELVKGMQLNKVVKRIPGLSNHLQPKLP